MWIYSSVKSRQMNIHQEQFQVKKCSKMIQIIFYVTILSIGVNSLPLEGNLVEQEYLS